MSDDIRKFEMNPEEYSKLVDKKLAQIREILAPEEFAELMAAVAKDPEAVPEARMQRVIMDLYAAQEALMSAVPRNIYVLGSSGLIDPDKGKALFVLASLLESKVAEALEEVVQKMSAEADAEAAKPALHIVH